MGTMSLAEIMDRSIEVLRKYFKTVVMYTLGFGIVFLIALVLILIVDGIFIGIFGFALSNVIIPSIIISLTTIVIFAFYLTSSIGLIKITSQEFFQDRIYANEAIRASFKCVFKVLGVTTVILIMFLPIIGIFGIITFYLYSTYYNSIIHISTLTPNIVFLIILSIFLLLAAAFVILAYFTIFCFSLHAITIENKGVIASLKRSYFLVKNSFWRIFGSIFLIYMTLFALRTSIEGLFTIIMAILYYVLKFLNMNIEYTGFVTAGLLYIRWPLSIIYFLVITPLGTLMLSLLYFNQRFKTEGFDILLKLKEIQIKDERKHTSEIGTYDNSH